MSDEAQVRENLHRSAYYYFKRTLTCFQLPIIVLSAISGSMQFLSKSYPTYESSIVTCTGSLSILVSIVSAVMTYLKLGEQLAKHEVAQTAWQNFYNNLTHQLNLSRELRDDPTEFVATVKLTYDRLFEISPIVSKSFIRQVKQKVSKGASPEFQIPPYLNGFKHTKVWSDEDDYHDNESNDAEMI